MPSEKHEAVTEDMKSRGKILAKRVRDGHIFYLSGHSWIPLVVPVPLQGS